MVLNTSTFVVYIPANIYLFKVNNRHTRRRCKKMFKVNNKDTRALSMTSFLCFYLLPLNTLFHTFFQCFFCWLCTGKCFLGLNDFLYWGCWVPQLDFVKPSMDKFKNISDFYICSLYLLNASIMVYWKLYMKMLVISNKIIHK